MSSKFLREFKKVSAEIREDFKEKLLTFQKNPFDPSLRTHKLHGKSEECWSFSVTYGHRVLFIQEKGDYVLIQIGPHDDVY